MKLVSFTTDNVPSPHVGAIDGDGSIVDLTAATEITEGGGQSSLASMLVLIEAGESGLDDGHRALERGRQEPTSSCARLVTFGFWHHCHARSRFEIFGYLNNT